MPCYDPETSEYPIRAAKKINFLTQMFCRVCHNLEEAGTFPNDKELQEWWAKHKKADELREELKRVKQQLKESNKPFGWGNLTWEYSIKLEDEISKLIGT